MCQEIKKIDGCDTEKAGTIQYLVDSNGKPIAILLDRWWPQAVEENDNKIREHFLRDIRMGKT